MTGPLRSKQGCWTCRLRKKKCDERRDSCSTCEALAIPCYGFGPKPDWLDGGEQERAVSNSLKDIAKRSSKKPPPSQASRADRPFTRIAARSTDDPVVSMS